MFEFKSQICTTKEQSEKLLSLGLKQETADMYLELTYSRNFETHQSSEEWKPHLRPYSELLEDCEKFNIPIYFKHIIPAWSLGRLIELLNPVGYLISKENPFQDAILDLETLIQKNYFNKDYLNE
jgi:hypothetical protein